MIVRQFQTWAEAAPAPSRADGVSALARAYLYSDLDPVQRGDAARALTAFLDDPSPLVRRALASAFASAADAPHAIVLALADDQPSIADIVLSRSPILSDAELIDRIEAGDAASQGAIARRAHLSTAVVDRLAAIAGPAALVVLAANAEIVLSDRTIERMVARHGAQPALREALLARGHLPLAVRAALVAATAGALAALVTQRAWISNERTQRITREASERATIAIAAEPDAEPADLRALAAHLRESGHMTVALALRTLLSGNRPLFEAMLGDLSGVAAGRVEGLTRHFQSAGFAALYRKAGFPPTLLPAFRIALAALRDHAVEPTQGAALSAPLVSTVLARCLAAADGGFDRLLVLLQRFDSEAARDEARANRTARSASAAPAPAPAILPSTARGDDLPRAAIHFDEAVPMARAVAIRTPEPARFTIDLAAIEAELIAA